MNLLTSEMLEALQEALEAIAGDKRVRVVVIAANGKGFCAGHDVREIRALKELPKIEQLARSIDPECFMIISRVSEVWGRGFSYGKKEKAQ
jgi:enoyl-CoA hydratase/carnithine racemase